MVGTGNAHGSELRTRYSRTQEHHYRYEVSLPYQGMLLRKIKKIILKRSNREKHSGDTHVRGGVMTRFIPTNP